MATERKKFVHEGRTIYEWQQSLSEVELFITVPDGVKASMIECEITMERLKLGLAGNPPFIDERFSEKVKPKDSFWTMEDGEIQIMLQKMTKGSTWPCALVGHGGMSEHEVQEDQRRIMLERFQEENPGFDFSNAEFSGQVPDASTFMGGAQYDR